MIKLLQRLFSTNKISPTRVVPGQAYVTMGWDLHPSVTKDCVHVLPRSAEMIINAKYYPTGTVGEWPCDPDTGEKLPIDPSY